MGDLLDIAKRIKEVVSLEDLIGETVELRRAGRDVKGCCPFHEDASPSFIVSKDHYHCFGCNAHGDAIDWVMWRDNVEWDAAVRRLAREHNIHVEDRPPRREKRDKPVEPQKPRKHRNIGSAPGNKEFARHYGLTQEDFEQAGFSFVAHHFPGLGEQKCVAYPVALPSGRTAMKFKTMGRNEKNKREVVVDGGTEGDAGLIIDPRQDEASILVLTAGEEKALACFAAGYSATSLQSGEKAPTDGQIQMLQSAKPAEIIIAFDADEPGRKGANDAARKLHSAGFRVRVIDWGEDDKSDLNDVLRDRGAGALRSLLDSAVAFGRLPTSQGPPALPEFPLDALPTTLQRFAETVTNTLQIPPDLIAVGALCAISAALQGRLRAAVDPANDWFETVVLWGLCAAMASERKGPAIEEHCVRPLADIQRKMREKNREEMARIRSAIEIKTIQYQAMKRQAARGTPGAQEKCQNIGVELDQLRQKKAETAGQILSDDTTPEGMARTMHSSRGAAAIITSEAGILMNFLGRYAAQKGGSNLDAMLKAYSGESVTINRVAMPDPIFIPRAYLTLFLAPQPGLLASMAANSPELKMRGFLARILFALPQPRVGTRAPVGAKIDRDIVNEFRRVLGHCADTEAPEEGRPHIINMTDECRRMIYDLSADLEPRMGPDGDLSPIADWVGKAAGRAVRIAVLLHASKYAGDHCWITKPVQSDSLGAAIHIVREWGIPHAMATYRLLGVSSCGPERDAGKLWQWLHERRRPELAWREIQQSVKHWGWNSKTLSDAVTELEGLGYLAVEQKRGGASGPSQRVVKVGPF